VQRQIDSFVSNEGKRFRVLFTSEGNRDAMTGLDIPNIDALVTVGEGNDVQRIGRLTRLGRTFSRGECHLFKIIPGH
jgi:hypothetical protein